LRRNVDALTENDENADLSAATVLDRMINPDLPKVERCRFIRLTRADGRARRRRRTEEAQLLSSLFFHQRKPFSLENFFSSSSMFIS